ncbi:fatty acid synthase apf5 [Colletotrichum liriopes]|uniref:beta-ketoacyl-[acyl-carrier-protein] synthase I n=1 Tax=Colletotrichum liriopes TaxID=708192 RepID=A0AA37LZT9_9PEZI|nr:fatty acid synthase apf5 [Colletotrichum liriopes]
MHPESERELAHVLLVELLAIETQDVILGYAGTERIVEVGPTNILTDMMKKTWSREYKEADDARGVRREILGPKNDSAKIYYEHTVEEAHDTETPIPVVDETTMQSLDTSTAASTTPAPDPEVQGLSSNASETILEVPDTQVPVSAIVMGIIAHKLKKRPSSIASDKTINSLVGGRNISKLYSVSANPVKGRSTLTNEIIGDLHAEFANRLPDRAEDLPITQLFEALEKNHNGLLGQKTSSLIAKMVSSKFSGDFTQACIRQYLRDRWGLLKLRQDAVLLAAFPLQPASRMETQEIGKTFLDSVATAYFQQQGLSPPSAGLGSSPGRLPTFVDEKPAQLLTPKDRALWLEIGDSISRHLGAHQGPDSNDLHNADNIADETHDDSDVWLEEHGEDYARGIRTMLDLKRERVYDSSWNWNSQDIALLFTLSQQRNPEYAAFMDELSACIVNRSCERSLTQLRYLCSKNLDEKSYPGNVIRFCYEACLASKDRDPVFIDCSLDLAPRTTIDTDGTINFCEIPCIKLIKAPKFFENGVLTVSDSLSSAYAEDLEAAQRSGFSFRDKNVLLTGAGEHSIGADILKNLLSGGARVTVTTSSYSPEATRMYQAIYSRYGARGSVLRVLPFNQGSRRDVEMLGEQMTDDWDLDFIIPFAATSENGRDLENIDSKSELAHRLMFTNLMRLLGAVARSKRLRGITTRPATAVLPFSPNHGILGNDGLYSESKRALEPLLAKWSTENWHDYLSVLGAVIGWTRGTGLMGENDIVAQGIELLGVQTFSRSQMAAYITSLIGGRMNMACQSVPLVVDLSGGMGKIKKLKDVLAGIRRDLRTESGILRAIREENERDAAVIGAGAVRAEGDILRRLSPKGNIQLQLPRLPDYETELSGLARSLEGMVDPSRVVVIVGFSELGPLGNSRTRWEMEAEGILSLNGCIEMAWMMGLIKYDQGVHKNGTPWSGWVDARTGILVEETEILARYMGFILEHTGIRMIEPDICDNGYDPEKKACVQEVSLQRDLPPFEAAPEAAREFKNQYGNKAIVSREESGAWTVQLKAGATVLLPKASRFNRTVAGQIPTGWSAKRYGIEDEIINQVDPVTLFALVCTVEAFLCSGIVDPYELYRHIHISELGSCIGSSMGGLSSLRQMHRGRFLDRPVQGDVLQETFVNTTGAWINMLLTSSTGPIKTPVGACATSLESLDSGYDLIVDGKVKVCLVGGIEDFTEDVSFEFGSMGATCNTDTEFAKGRSPRQMSRPMASSRSGFVESQGCGIQVLTTAELALEMGLPIFGVVTYTSMAADKIGRSVPAPGKGILTNARESHDWMRHKMPSPMLDINYRRRLLNMRRQQIQDSFRDNLCILEHEIDYLRLEQLEGFDEAKYRQQKTAHFEKEVKRQDSEVTCNLGNHFWKREPDISPIRGSLAVWGLGIDDLTVASMHGTSTVQNDVNEASVIQEQMQHLGRTEGNLLPCVCQKWLTGHGKGAAGAWMINGCLQMMDSGVIPGNRNADNIDSKLQQHRYLYFPNTTQTEDVKACSVTSFGFGQKGSQAIVVHPRYLFATMQKDRYEHYSKRRHERWQRACQYFNEGMVHGNLVATKTSPPYDPSHESKAMLDPTARFCCQRRLTKQTAREDMSCCKHE